MTSAVHHLLLYLRLAVVSSDRNQRLGQDRFLVLAAEAACRAGLSDIANRCREMILAHNPRHAVGHYESFWQALQDAEFTPLLKHLKQLCPPEQAEFLWQQYIEGEDATASAIQRAYEERQTTAGATEAAEENPDSFISAAATAHRLLDRIRVSA